jgi:Tfp pilus assembly protein PilN
MINLLPPQVRESIAYANKNTKLRVSAVSLLLLAVAVFIMFLGGTIYLKQSSNSTAKQAASTRGQLELRDQASIKKQVAELSDTFKLVDKVLSDQVLFSKLLQKIGSVIPDGSILTALSINELEGGLNLQAKAKSYDSATQVQVNLADEDNGLFEQVDIVNIQCETDAASDETQSTYPCTIQLRALFGNTNPFLFINDGVSDE